MLFYCLGCSPHSTWSEKSLYKFLKNPKSFLPGTTMCFRGLRKSQDRVNLIEYLRRVGCGDEPFKNKKPVENKTKDDSKASKNSSK